MRVGSALRSAALLSLIGGMQSVREARRVAVVGAGAAGLCAARRLAEKGLGVRVFEKAEGVGGVWRYRPGRVMYEGLVTNLPKEIMAFGPGDPFDASLGRSFLTHADVLAYLEAYAAKHDVLRLIETGAEVESAEKLAQEEETHLGARWRLTVRTASGAVETDTFDALVVANGHYDAPMVPDIDGLAPLLEASAPACDRLAEGSAPPPVVFSRAYDTPSAFKNLRVLVVGARASGTDIGRELRGAAARVEIVDRARSESLASPEGEGDGGTGPLVLRPAVSSLQMNADRSVRASFSDGAESTFDCVVLCTGYDYAFPFLPALSCARRRVDPLYLQLFHCADASLSFIGIPHSVVPFPLFDLQSRLVAAVCAGDAALPPPAERRAALERDYAAQRAEGLRVEDAHWLSSSQWSYDIALLRALREAGAGDDGGDAAFVKWLGTARQIYEDLAKRRPPFPGAHDAYRALSYSVGSDGGWTVSGEGGEVLGRGAGVPVEDMDLEEAMAAVGARPAAKAKAAVALERQG